MASQPRLRLGGTAAPLAGARTSIFRIDINRPGQVYVLEALCLETAVNGNPTIVVYEIVSSGGALETGNVPLSVRGRILPLPFYRVDGVRDVQVFVTSVAGGSVGAVVEGHLEPVQ
jgi:hypothetical protein